MSQKFLTNIQGQAIIDKMEAELNQLRASGAITAGSYKPDAEVNAIRTQVAISKQIEESLRLKSEIAATKAKIRELEAQKAAASASTTPPATPARAKVKEDLGPIPNTTAKAEESGLFKVISKAEFNKLSPRGKSDYCRNGGKIAG